MIFWDFGVRNKIHIKTRRGQVDLFCWSPIQWKQKTWFICFKTSFYLHAVLDMYTMLLRPWLDLQLKWKIIHINKIKKKRKYNQTNRNKLLKLTYNQTTVQLHQNIIADVAARKRHQWQDEILIICIRTILESTK